MRMNSETHFQDYGVGVISKPIKWNLVSMQINATDFLNRSQKIVMTVVLFSVFKGETLVTSHICFACKKCMKLVNTDSLKGQKIIWHILVSQIYSNNGKIVILCEFHNVNACFSHRFFIFWIKWSWHTQFFVPHLMKRFHARRKIRNPTSGK